MRRRSMTDLSLSGHRIANGVAARDSVISRNFASRHDELRAPNTLNPRSRGISSLVRRRSRREADRCRWRYLRDRVQAQLNQTAYDDDESSLGGSGPTTLLGKETLWPRYRCKCVSRLCQNVELPFRLPSCKFQSCAPSTRYRLNVGFGNHVTIAKIAVRVLA